MNTEKLKQAALKATWGRWYVFKTYSEPEIRTESDVFIVSFPLGSIDNASYIAAANPSTILALLECVDALRDMLEQFTKTPSTLKDSQARVKGHAALQKLEVL